MIIKKPYAFLIRHFRLIHIALSALLIFIAYQSSSIYNFFNSYVKEGHYTYYPNLSSHFINYYSFIVIVLIIIIGITLYILLKWKDKKTFFYISLCLYYIFIFLIYIYFFNIFQSIEFSNLSIKTIRLDRDFALLMAIPQFIFISVSIFRGIGFDIRKFNFSKDLQDLSVNVKDNEEVEVILATDTYKYMRTIRRGFRELRYFVLESKFALLIVSSLVVLVFGLVIFLNKEVYNKTYNESENFYSDLFNIEVIDSYLTSVGYDGSTISKNKYYIVIKLKVQNNGTDKKSLDSEKYRLVVKSKEYLPNLTKSNYMIDLGESYISNKILPGKEYNYLLTYELDKEVVSKNYMFRIVNEVSLLKGDIKSNHINIKLNPKPFNERIIMNNLNIKDTIKLNDSSIEDSSIAINSFDIAEYFNETYQYCINGKCNTGIVNIKPQVVGNSDKYVLKLDTTYNIDSNHYIKKFILSANDFMDYFASINYIIDSNEKTADVKIIESKYTAKNIAYLEVPKEIKDAREIYLMITIRNINYKIKLK